MLVAEKYAGVQDAESKNVVILFVFVVLVKFWPHGEGEWEIRTRN